MPSEQFSRPPLGKLEKIDLSTYWQGEDTDFTPWLAQADNLKLLGDSLGMTLESVTEDQPSGTLWADLLCRDQISDRWVLIENQLETTDFSHLGRLITCAAAMVGCDVVWIASHFLPEHRAALDWLNQVTPPEVNFYGLEIELWRISHSVAVNFNPVSQPQVWRQPDLEAATAAVPEAVPDIVEAPLSETEQQNLDFWCGLCQHLEQRGSIVKPGTPVAQAVMSFTIGRAGFRLYASIDREDGCLYTELLLSGEDAQPHFYLLAEDQAVIEAEMEMALAWDDQAGEKACAIYCTLPEATLDHVDRWADYYQWFYICLERFHEVFADRIKHLNATDYQPMPDYSFNPLNGSLILPS